jgi:medium-chain acyl-[acyl-carrier-protein] hydrolase
VYRADIHNQWLWRYGSHRDGDVRVFCVPCAGHGASMFRTWADYLPRAFEVWALQLPGRENRLEEPAIGDLTTLVREVASALDPLIDDRPYAIVGHSLGALIGFEVARELRRRGRPLPWHLFASGHPAPQEGPPQTSRCHLPDAIFLRTVQQLNTTLAADEEYLDAMRFMLPTLRTDFTLCERYRYVDERPLSCPLTAWGGDHDPEATVVQLAGWREQTTAAFSLKMFPGDHFFPMTQRKVVLRTLVEAVEPLLGHVGGHRQAVGAAGHA